MDNVFLDFIVNSPMTVIWLLIALFIIAVIFKGVRIVPQSQKFVVERFGRLHSVLGPG
ncbi:MAG: SPFH/Band 7/PHB domain protein, partial [Pseudomonadota bacterium]|nr:SPFH/Band 7/PHB domain protein [Pseudomonadota bacterium]